MTDPSTTRPGKTANGAAFSVAASPYNSIKLELAIILIIAFVLWAVLNSITDNDVTHVAILLLYSMSGALWIILRIRRISMDKPEI